MVKVILLCDQISTDCVDEIVEYGARGCLLIGDEPDTYVNAILAVDGGDIWLPRRLLAYAFAEMLSKPDRQDATATIESPDAVHLFLLTQREQCIAKLVAQGLTNKQIARQLQVCEDTVKKHLKNIFEKLGVHRRSQVVQYRLNRSLIPPEG